MGGSLSSELRLCLPDWVCEWNYGMLQDLDRKPSTGTKSEQERRGNGESLGVRSRRSEWLGLPTAQVGTPQLGQVVG